MACCCLASLVYHLTGLMRGRVSGCPNEAALRSHHRKWFKASSIAEQSGPAGRLRTGIRGRGHNWWQLQAHYVTTVHPQPCQWTTAGELHFARIDAAARVVGWRVSAWMVIYHQSLRLPSLEPGGSESWSDCRLPVQIRACKHLRLPHHRVTRIPT